MTIPDLGSLLDAPGYNSTGVVVPLCNNPRDKGFWALWALVIVLLATVLGVAGCGREAPFAEPGNITVASTPSGAAISLNGVDTGEVTPHTFVGLDADRYDVSVQLTDFISTPGSIPVDLSPLDQVNLSFALSQTGLVITSVPEGASIFIDGTDTEQVTPATIAGLDAGQIDIALVLDSYLVSPTQFSVEVIEDSVVTIAAETFSLRPQRTVILEGFANTGCIPCPQLTNNLVAMVEKPEFGPERVLYLEFSVNWPNPADPLYLHNATENSNRFTNYFVLGAPALYTNGAKLADALDAPAMEAAVLAELGTDPGFLIDVSANFTNPLVPVSVTLDAAVDRDLSGYSLFVALYERVIDFDERGLPVGPNNQVIFHHVFRDRVDTPPALGGLTAGTPAVYEVSLSRGDWPLDNLVVVAYVQRDSDHAILQAGSFGETAETGGTP